MSSNLPSDNTVAQILAYLDGIEHSLSGRWRENTNRRTILIILIFGLLSIYTYLYLIRPPDQFPLETIVNIPAGQTGKQVSEILQNDGVVRSAFVFRIMATLQGHERDLHAGDYLFTEPLDVFHVARTIGIGAFGLEPLKIRVGEGETVRQMATIFSIELQDFNAQNFLTLATPLEGYLFPDTYYFLPNADENTVIESMRQDFDLQVAAIQPQIEAFGHPLSDDVIMASIVEREANNTKDRQMIAGVLWNRLARGMPLQTDVTFLYTLGKTDSQLTMSDLKNPSVYNTYAHKGLPPGPIGSPSLDSLLATVTPTKSNYLYYLADSNGVTHYCANFACQQANEREYLGN
jgi:UPF0755 protein